MVITISDNSGEVYYDLGYKIGGCNFVLNSEQVNAETDYQPNIETRILGQDGLTALRLYRPMTPCCLVTAWGLLGDPRSGPAMTGNGVGLMVRVTRGIR